MVQMQSNMEVADNSGAKRITVITILGQKRRFARVGDIVTAAVKEAIPGGGVKKGDVLSVAQLAGVMGAKRTPELIPLCHPLALDRVGVTLFLNEDTCAVEIRAEVAATARTGVEMEALTAASVAALTVYDMCKAVQRDIVIDQICLLRKSGGKSGDFVREV